MRAGIEPHYSLGTTMVANGIPDVWNRLREWARRIKCDVVALWLAARDSRTPCVARAIAAAIAACALSPVDLIPDFIPVVGYLDDVILVPIGVLLAVRLIPEDLMAEFRAAAARRLERTSSLVGLAFILTVWLAGTALLLKWLWPWNIL